MKSKIRAVRNSDKKAYLYTLLFTAIITAFLIYKLQLYPFGDHNLRYSDCDQYFGFYGYLLSTFFSKSNLLYSWSKVLGGSMLSTYAYYASSPLNLLLFFFQNDLSLGVNFIALLRTFLTALNFCILLNALYPSNSLSKGLFSASYAFIGYISFFSWNGSWMDAVMMLPLLVLGMRRMLTEKKNLLYILVLAFCLFSNFYTGYMLCLATVLFYLFYLLEEKHSFLSRLKTTFFRYIICSILGVGLSACLVVPAFFGLPSGRRQSLSELLKNLKFNFNPLDFLPQFYTGAMKLDDQSANMPLIFIGIIPFVLLIAFFLNRKIPVRRRVLSGILCLVLFFSFEISIVNVAWHGFSDNVWFNYRYSFLLSFVFLLLAFEGYLYFQTKGRKILILAAVFLGITAVTFYQGRPSFSIYSISFDVAAALIAIIAIRMYYAGPKAWGRAAQVVLAVLVLADMGLNSYSSMREGVGTTSVQNYKVMQANVEALKSDMAQDGFYRIGSLYTFGRCDASQFNYAGITDYASTENKPLLAMVRKFGASYSWMWGAYNSNMPSSSDDLFGIRYVITPGTLLNKDYTLAGESNGVSLYENEDALPFIYPVDHVVELGADLDNVFAFQNAYWKALSSEDLGDVFATPEMTMEESASGDAQTESGAAGTSQEGNGSAGDAQTSGGNSGAGQVAGAQAANVQAEAAQADGTQASAPLVQDITLTISSDVSGRLYIRLPEMNTQKVTIEVPDMQPENVPAYSAAQELYYVGDIEAGEERKVILHVTGGVDTKDIFAGVEQEKIEKEYVDCAASSSPDVQERSSSKLEFTTDYGSTTLLSSSIPYDPCWKIMVDGEKVEQQNSGGFLAFSVPFGSHSVVLSYMPKGLLFGIGISILSGILVILMCILQKWKRKENH